LIIRASALQPRPWPNGLGTTRDVVAQNRSDTRFDWLISIADLVESAAFSHFPACDRIFTLIEGDGVTLTLDEMSVMPCRPFVPASFPGDRPTICTITDGPARAFNLFFDRARFNGQVMVRSIAASHAIHTGSNTVAVHCASGTLEGTDGRLAAGDTLVDSGAAIIRTTDAAAIAVIVLMEARDPTRPA
jgi:uncharacterized protein